VRVLEQQLRGEQIVPIEHHAIGQQAGTDDFRRVRVADVLIAARLLDEDGSRGNARERRETEIRRECARISRVREPVGAVLHLLHRERSRDVVH
jgi:hypothetical protein